MTVRCFYFGCWNQPGHYLFLPGGRHAWNDDPICSLKGSHGTVDWIHIDSALAPMLSRRTGALTCSWIAGDRYRLGLEECPQGQFLRHVLPSGFTALQWWDRNQGDTRGACNSSILLEGEHTTEEMLAALREHFPHVLENLTRHGVELVEVFAT